MMYYGWGWTLVLIAGLLTWVYMGAPTWHVAS